MNGDTRTRWSERWFRLLLPLYPTDFREEMGDALVDAYLHRAHAALSRGGRIRLAGVWITALIDSLRNGLGERLRPAAAWRRRGNWGRDLELTRRRLMRSPMFVITTIATLTVGLGTFAVVFTAVDKILLEPLPYRDAGDLYKVWADVPYLNVKAGQLSAPQIGELQKAGGVIEDAVAFNCGNAAIPAADNRDAFHINMMVSTANLFEVLGVQPARGRAFRHDEGGRWPTSIVLSDGMWKRLGADPGIVGKPLRIGPDTHTVVGVMGPEFAFTCWPSQTPDVYAPSPQDLTTATQQNISALTMIRARRGTSAQQIHQAVERVGQSWVERFGVNRPAGMRFYAVGLQADLIEEIRPALLALAAAGSFLLLVLAVNFASVLLARASEREREFAISRALGASGPAILRAGLFEGALLGVTGGVMGALVGIWGTRLLLDVGPLDLPRRESVIFDWRMGATVIIVGTLIGLMAAAVPAAWAARISLSSLVSATMVRGSASAGRMRRSLIAAQIALSLVLLSAGALVVRSFERLVAADPGFISDHVLTLRLSTIVFPQEADAMSFLDRTTAALRALPGVTSVSAASTLPLSGGTSMNTVLFPRAPGNTGDEQHDRPLVDRFHARAGYIKTMGMRLRAGREFDEARQPGVREALIDRHLAEQFFPNSNPLGSTMTFDKNSVTIVGVVDQARLNDLDKDGRPQIFVRAEDYGSRGYWFFVIRTTGEPQALIQDARGVIRRIEPRIPVSKMLTMDEIVADQRSRERISAVVIAGLALGALLLVAVGLFAVISGSVTRRRGELAVRIALGATHGRVMRLLLSEGALLVCIGLVMGAPGVYAVGSMVRGLLIDISPWDAPTLSAAALGLALVAMAACYVPARRVLRIDPAPLLRQN
jgi:putative ABC transport system permease protein